jgi:hypothetical protein
MKQLSRFATSPAGQVIIIGGILTIIGYSARKRAGEVGQTVVDAVNPTKETNLVYRGVNGIGATLSGNDNFDLGRSLYDLFN